MTGLPMQAAREALEPLVQQGSPEKLVKPDTLYSFLYDYGQGF